MKRTVTFYVIALLHLVNLQATEYTPYNILFIAIDDLNDWTGFLGGHPDALTPHMDELAASGMVFENAHCAVPSCNPSRCAIMAGFKPWGSGIYTNPGGGRSHQNLRVSPVTTTAYTLPEYLSNHGYYTLSRGKIYHFPTDYNDTWDYWEPNSGSYGSINGNHFYRADRVTWGATDQKAENTMDFLAAKWASGQLQQDFDKPFFMACGIFRPHLPWYVPQEFFDKFNIDSIDLPTINTNDLNDIGFVADSDYSNLETNGKLREAAWAYLANVNYADSCVGIIMDALKKSKYYENTIVILWGDHGWHLGEKLRYRKFTLWEEATRMPLIIRVPGVTPENARSKEPVNLVDIYPTLTHLCQLPPNTNNQGKNLAPILYGEADTLDNFTVTTYKEGNHAIRTRDFRYIRRIDNREELYDHRVDSNEHTNLWLDASYKDMIESFSTMLDSILLLDTPTVEKAIYPHRIPGVIQAEKYNRGGEGISYHDTDPENNGMLDVDFPYGIYYRNNDGVDISTCNDVGGGYAVSYISKGEWLEYTIEKVVEGDYNIGLRVASGSDNAGSVNISLDGSVIASIDVPNTQSDSNWQYVTTGKIKFKNDSNVMLKATMNGSGFLLNRISILDFSTINSKEIPGEMCEMKVYQTGNRLKVESSTYQQHCRVSIYDISGRNIKTIFFEGRSIEIPMDENLNDGILIVKVGSGTVDFTKKIVYTNY